MFPTIIAIGLLSPTSRGVEIAGMEQRYRRNRQMMADIAEIGRMAAEMNAGHEAWMKRNRDLDRRVQEYLDRLKSLKPKPLKD